MKQSRGARDSQWAVAPGMAECSGLSGHRSPRKKPASLLLHDRGEVFHRKAFLAQIG